VGVRHYASQPRVFLRHVASPDLLLSGEQVRGRGSASADPDPGGPAAQDLVISVVT